VETYAGSREFAKLPNPRSAEQVAMEINRLCQEVPHQAVSFTGGEPLLHADFIREVAREVEVPVFLKTNGTLYKQLESIIDITDIISMDIKLPQATGEEHWEEHRRFLEIAKKKDVYVKLVVSGDINMDDYQKAVDLVAGVDPNILLILQPVTPLNGVEAARPEQMLELQQQALESLNDVRIIPQTHRMMDQL
jgi:organic radical activating enzyme